jgi:hypothetical protein
MSDLAERSEAKRGGTPGQSGAAEQSGAGSQSKSKATQSGAGEKTDEMPASDPGTGADDALSAGEADSLLAQIALVLGPVADGAPATVQGEVATESQLTANEQGTLKSSWQLLSSLANGSDGEAQAGVPDSAVVPNALAALSDGIEETTFANLMAPGSSGGEDTVSETSFPAMKVTVTGEETHFAPVQSAESALSRLLNGAAANADGTLAGSADGASTSEGEDAVAKSAGGAGLAAGEAPKPAAGLGSALDSGGGKEGSGGERRLADGQTQGPTADQQGGRSGAIMAAEFQAAAPSGGAGLSSDASPGAQIARRIAAELANPASRPATSTSSNDGAVKVLHLQLEPANMGSVTVRIALKDNVISLQMEASRHETAFAIEKDRELLSNALKSAGYMVDGISSQAATDPARPSLQAQAVSNDGQMSSSLQSQADSQSGLAQSGRGNQGEQGRQFTESALAPASQVNESRSEGSRTSNGALYV